MQDIVEQLKYHIGNLGMRNLADYTVLVDCKTLQDAIDEIVRLRFELEQFKSKTFYLNTEQYDEFVHQLDNDTDPSQSLIDFVNKNKSRIY